MFDAAEDFPEDARRFVRRYSLGSLQKRFWLVDQASPTHIVLAAELAGVAHRVDWENALDQISLRHPLCSVCIEKDDSGEPQFVTDRKPIPLTIKKAPVGTLSSLISIELGRPINVSASPMMRVTVLENGERSIIIVTVHHTIADGRAIVFLIEDLASAMRGERLAPLGFPPTIDELTQTPTQTARSGISQRIGGNEAPQVARRAVTVSAYTLSQEITAVLRLRAKAEGTTVHGAMCAALVLAGRQRATAWRGKDVRVVSPIDVRGPLRLLNEVGLFITSKTVAFPPRIDEPFWEVARFARSSLLPVPTLSSVVEQTRALSQLFATKSVDEAAEVLNAGKAREMMVTNLGVVPSGANRGPFRILSIWGPLAMSGSAGEQTISVATVEGRLQMSVASRDPIPSLLD